MSILTFLAVGLIAGWLAGQVMKGGGYGVVGDIILGVVGAYLGSWIFGMLGVVAGGTIGTIVVATIGAIVLVFLTRLIKKN